MAWMNPQQEISFANRLARYWDHPDPHGLVAQLKAALDGMAGAVNASAILAGPPPSTEEEAFRYNQARTWGPGAAFQAVSALSPGVPKGTGGLLARAFAEAARNSPGVGTSLSGNELTGLLRQAADRQGLERSIERQGRSPQKMGAGQVPFNLGPNSQTYIYPGWDASTPFAVPLAPPPLRQPLPEDRGTATANKNDLDFRQLSRMPPALGDDGDRSAIYQVVPPKGIDRSVDASTADASGDSSSANAELWAGQGKSPNARTQSSNGSGGAQGVGGNGGGDDESASLDNRGGGLFDTFRRCTRAATRNAQAWTDFCDDLDPDDLQLRAICRSNTYKTKPEKKGFCANHFTI